MSTPINNGGGRGFVAKSFDSTGPHTTGDLGTALFLEEPCSKWSLTTLIGSTAATIILEGTATSSSDSPFSTIMAATASTDGETASTSGFVARQVRTVIDTISSSEKAVHAWVAGVP